MRPYGSKKVTHYDTEPRIKSARAVAKREAEELAAEQLNSDVEQAELEVLWRLEGCTCLIENPSWEAACEYCKGYLEPPEDT